MNNKFKIYTLGCKVNQYDSTDLSRRLIAAGLIVANKNVDIAIKIVKYAYHLGARRICVPCHETLPRDFFSRLNLKENVQTRCTRMFFGENISEDSTYLYASYAFATG